jgi:hypothetical protein
MTWLSPKNHDVVGECCQSTAVEHGGGIVLAGLWLGKQAAGTSGLLTRQRRGPARGPTVIAASFGLSRSFHNSSHGPQQRGNLPPGLNP